MENPRPDKVAVVDEVRGKLEESNAAVLTEYRGLNVSATADLRRALRDAGGEYKIYKNTLVRIAARDLGLELDDLLTGPTAIAFVTGDIAAATKGLRDFAKANPFLAIKGGVLEGKFLDSQAVLKLADLESREVLLAKMAGALQANLAKAAYMLAAPLSQGARVLGALQSAAEANPSLIGGAGSAPAAEATDETPAADAATEAAPAAE